MDISKTLKYYRKMCGLTQQQVSIVIGKERSCYAKYETGAANPPLETLEVLAKLFNVSVANILDNTLAVPEPSTTTSTLFSAKNYDEQELLMIFRTLSDSKKKELLDSLKADFLN